MKNSSRLVSKMEKNFTRSSNGWRLSWASSNTRRLNSIKLNSRLIKRSGRCRSEEVVDVVGFFCMACSVLSTFWRGLRIHPFYHAAEVWCKLARFLRAFVYSAYSSKGKHELFHFNYRQPNPTFEC